MEDHELIVEDDFIKHIQNELRPLGLILVQYEVIELKKGEVGVHNLLWRIDNKEAARNNWQAIVEIMSRDDDGQPESRYVQYFDNVFQYIAFFA